MQQVLSSKTMITSRSQLPDGQEIKGEYDMEMDGRIDDVKSASDLGHTTASSKTLRFFTEGVMASVTYLN